MSLQHQLRLRWRTSLHTRIICHSTHWAKRATWDGKIEVLRKYDQPWELKSSPTQRQSMVQVVQLWAVLLVQFWEVVGSASLLVPSWGQSSSWIVCFCFLSCFSNFDLYCICFICFWHFYLLLFYTHRKICHSLPCFKQFPMSVVLLLLLFPFHILRGFCYFRLLRVPCSSRLLSWLFEPQLLFLTLQVQRLWVSCRIALLEY